MVLSIDKMLVMNRLCDFSMAQNIFEQMCYNESIDGPPRPSSIRIFSLWLKNAWWRVPICLSGCEYISRLVETRRGKKNFLQAKIFL